MTDLFDSKAWEEMANDNVYEKAYPRINQVNVFSASTLAYDVQKQVDWKVKVRKGGSSMNAAMFQGKCIHEFYQKRLRERFSDTICEREVEITYPFAWQNYPFTSFTVLGHVDAIIPHLGLVIEIKSSDWSSEIKDFMRRQLGFYLVALLDPYARGLIVKINRGAHVEPMFLSDAQKWAAEVETRGRECAAVLDKLEGEKPRV
jgi:hypothetical protein